MFLIVYRKAGLDVIIVRSIRLSSNPNLKGETNLSGGVSTGSPAVAVNDDNSFFDSLSRALSDKWSMPTISGQTQSSLFYLNRVRKRLHSL